jgi:hypothetical protein
MQDAKLYAFEFVSTPCGLFSDGEVNGKDLGVFAEEWLWSGFSDGGSKSDFNNDGRVDVVDYAIFALEWFESCF